MADAPILFMITTAGLDALVNAQGGSTEPIEVVSVGITPNAFTMAPTITALPGELKRIEAVSGQAVSETVIHMTAQDASEDIYELRGLGLYLADGTLFAVFSQPTPLFRKVSISFFLLALDISFANGVAGAITFGDTTFLLPPASETVKGVAEIADAAEAAAGTDDLRIVSPKKLRQVFNALGELIAPGSTNYLSAFTALLARTITGGGLATGGGNLTGSRVITVAAASATDVDTGTASDKAVTPAALKPTLDRTIEGGGLVTGGGSLRASRTLTVTAASAADVDAGTASDKAVTPASLKPMLDRTIEGGGLVTGGGSLRASRTLTVTAASAADVDTGTVSDKAVTPAALKPTLDRTIEGGGLVTGGGSLRASRTLTVTAASGADVDAGTASDKAVTPAALKPTLDRTIEGGGLVTGGGSLRASRTLTVTAASADDVDAGTASDKAVTPAALKPTLDRTIEGAGLVTGGGSLRASRTLTVTAASAADVDAGTASDKAVTPAALKPTLDRTISGGGLVTGGGSLRASRTLTVTAASAADVVAGLLSDKAITPFALAQGLAQLGAWNPAVPLFRIPGTPIIVQAGTLRTLVTTELAATIAFPLAFPTACLWAGPIAYISADNNRRDLFVQMRERTAENFTVFFQAGDDADNRADGLDWLAVGY